MAAGKLLLVVCMYVGTGMFCNSAKERQSPKVVEDATGYTTIKNGEKIKERIKAIEEMQQKRVKEAEEVE